MLMLAVVLFEPCRTSPGLELVMIKLLLLICTGLFAVNVPDTLRVLATETLPASVTFPDACVSAPVIDV